MAAEHVERKLAAILSADVVGYSRLMAEDEAATIRTLSDYREAVAMLVRQRRGRVVDAPGDNLLAEFPTALDAVRCAVEVQAVLGARNASLPPERRMEFRIGIHMGDVAVEEDRLYGDGVNIAARLEGLAEAGGVCISATVHEQVRNKLDVGYTDLGDQTVKNIPDLVHVYRVRLDAEPKSAAAAGGEATAADRLTVSGFGERPAIAVLPFDNMSGDPEQEYFADGIAEDLITRLSAWRRFPVIARNSSFVYKGEAVDVKRLSQELGVRYVVEGSVRKAGDRVRVTAQLIDATTGHHVWAERYDRRLEDIFALQDEITQAIVEGIEPSIRAYEPERAIQRDPRNLDAWDLAQRGNWHAQRMTREDSDQARQLFERALELDPRSVSALGGLALVHYLEVYLQWTESAERSVSELVRCAETAVACDEKDPHAQIALATAYSLTGPQDKMLAAAERAVELNPSLATAYFYIGNFLALAGRPEEAIASLEKGMRLSPRDPLLFGFLSGMAWAHAAAGRDAEAIDWARRSLKQRSDWIDGLTALAASCAHLGRLEEAQRVAEDIRRLHPKLSLSRMDRFLAGATAPEFTRRILDGLRKAGVKE
jgi:adenylate cyclase